MDAKQVLKELESLGTAQNRKVYARHGVTGAAFGVSYANLYKLARRIKTDHELALALWKSGNHDARVLATMVCDGARLDAKTLDAWLKDCANYVVADAFAGAAAGSPPAKKRMETWIRSRDEWVSSAGWSVLARLAERPDVVSDAELGGHLATIEKRIHAAPNRTRYAMNTALIAIGLRSPALQKRALAAAKRIGRVEVDHGETGCKTPDAATYIVKAAAHRSKRAAAKAR